MRTSLLMSRTDPGMAFSPASRNETMPVAFQFSARLVSADFPQQLPMARLRPQLRAGGVLVTVQRVVFDSLGTNRLRPGRLQS
jgi:hypothetical protein